MKGFVSWLNIISLCAFAYTPLYLYDKNISVPLIFSSLMLWFITSNFIEAGWLKRMRPFAMPLFGIISVELLSCWLLNEPIYGFISSAFLAYTGLFFWQFYQKHLNHLKLPLLFLILILLLDGFDTIIGNMLFPGASRKQSEVYDALEASIMQQNMHIGGFPFLFAVAFMMLPIGLFIKYNVLKKSLGIFLIIFNFTVLFYGSYFISLIVSSLLLVIILPNIVYMKKNFLFAVLTIIFLFLLKDPILDFVVFIGDQTGSTFIVQHALDIKNGDLSSSGDVTGGRSELYMGAFLNFLNHPILGKMDGWTTGYESNHSELLEYFEKFGVFGFPFIHLWIAYYRELKQSLLSYNVQLYSKMYIGVLMFFLFVDPLRREQPLSMIIFCVIPLALKYIDKKISKKNEKTAN